jgi:hypothetical protein
MGVHTALLRFAHCYTINTAWFEDTAWFENTAVPLEAAQKLGFAVRDFLIERNIARVGECESKETRELVCCKAFLRHIGSQFRVTTIVLHKARGTACGYEDLV